MSTQIHKICEWCGEPVTDPEGLKWMETMKRHNLGKETEAWHPECSEAICRSAQVSWKGEFGLHEHIRGSVEEK